MNEIQFEQWIYKNYTIGDNAMARELLGNIFEYAKGMEPKTQYNYLCRMIPIPKRVIRNVAY